MLNVTVIAVGGLKENYLVEACAEYQKRLSAFCKLNIVEIGEYKSVRNPGAAEIEQALLSEGRAIISKLPRKALVAALCIEGKPMSSTELAGYIGKLESPQIAFVIGGSHGLSEEVKQRAQLKVSMSAMTFPHQLARVMLLEQLYRAFSILGGLKYHK